MFTVLNRLKKSANELGSFFEKIGFEEKFAFFSKNPENVENNEQIG